MHDYQYIARDITTGQEVEGVIAAESSSAAARLIDAKGLFPVKITEKKTTFDLKNIKFNRKIKTKHVVIFTRQLSTLVSAGLPITTALSTAHEQITDKSLFDIVGKVKSSVEGGTSLSKSFGSYPDVFDNLYVSLINAGEVSGKLDDALTKLAEQKEKQAKIVSKVRGALIYPVVVLFVIVAVVIFMITTVLPQITILYEDLGEEVPATTRILNNFSDFLTNFWYLAIAIVVAIVYLVRVYFKTERGKTQLDHLALNVPVFKTLIHKYYMAMFTRVLGSLTSSGVQILESLSISAGTMQNSLIRQDIIDSEKQVKSGISLSQAISEKEHFIKLVPQMIKIGEDSGTLSDMLDRVAAFYEEEVDQAVKNISTLIEPLLMVFLGIVVFGIIIAILYPIYSLVGGGISGGV